MRMENLKDLTKDELLQKREELKQDLFNLRMRRGVRDLDNPLKLRTLRREIARIETILSEDSRGIRKVAEQANLLDKGEAKKADSR